MPEPNSAEGAAEKVSGFSQCRTCGLTWFGRCNSGLCPEGPHGKPVQIRDHSRVLVAVRVAASAFLQEPMSTFLVVH